VAAGPVSKIALQQEKAFCVWLPCGCVSCDPGCTHWRILITKWENLDSCRRWRCMLCRVRWEIKFLLTFETAPFFCVCPVHKDYYIFYNLWDFTNLKYKYAFYFGYLNHAFKCLRMASTTETRSIYMDEINKICCDWQQYVCQF
jgi:hypothetical protein